MPVSGRSRRKVVIGIIVIIAVVALVGPVSVMVLRILDSTRGTQPLRSLIVPRSELVKFDQTWRNDGASYVPPGRSVDSLASRWRSRTSSLVEEVRRFHGPLQAEWATRMPSSDVKVDEFAYSGKFTFALKDSKADRLQFYCAGPSKTTCWFRIAIMRFGQYVVYLTQGHVGGDGVPEESFYGMVKLFDTYASSRLS